MCSPGGCVCSAAGDLSPIRHVVSMLWQVAMLAAQCPGRAADAWWWQLTESTGRHAHRGAKFLLRLLESLGADVKMARCSEEQNPLVLARLGHDPARPTVTFYGHYDVQPASEPEWRTNPFELVAVDGHLYGRWAGGEWGGARVQQSGALAVMVQEQPATPITICCSRHC